MQLEFNWRDPEALQVDLERLSGLSLRVVVTDNSSTLLSVRHLSAGHAATVRLHHMFLAADEAVLAALAKWIVKPHSRLPGEVLNRFMRAHQHEVRRNPARRQFLRTQGECVDLKALYDDVNATHFEGRVTARLTWGRMPTGGRRRSIRFGSYSSAEYLIRIHPLLDQPFVPRYFVRYIVFHEMLHAHLGVDESPSGRRRLHAARFKRLEQAYPDYERAVAWQSNPANLRRLLRATPAR